MRSMKKMYAVMLSVAMIAGTMADVMPVMAAEQVLSATEDEAAIAVDDNVSAMSEDEVIDAEDDGVTAGYSDETVVMQDDDETVMSDEAPDLLGGLSKTTGSGTASDPWNIAFDEVTEGEITVPEDASGSADTAQYYHYKLTKDTKLEITLKSPGSTRLDISKTKDFKKVMGFIENSPGKGRSLDPFVFYAGDYYLRISAKTSGTTSYQITVKNMGGSSKPSKIEPETGFALLNGAEAKSLKVAFYNVNDAAIDYTVDLQTDMIGEKDLTIPAKAKSVTINGNGHTIKIIGTKLTSGADLTLNDVTIQTVTTADTKVKFALTAKKSLNIGDNVKFDTAQTDIKATGNVMIGPDITAASLTGKDVVLNGAAGFSKLNCKALEVRKDLTAPKLTCTDLNLDATLTTDTLTCNNAALTGKGIIKTSEKGKYTIKKALISEGGKIELCAGFKTPIALNGTAEGSVIFTPVSAEDGSKVTFADGTQIIKCTPKKITADKLKTVFDISAISASGTDKVSSHLYYAGGSKACVFADSIDYNGKTYGVWNDVVTQMNTDKKSGAKAFTVTLNSDVNLNGAFKLPAKGYDSLTIEGNGHKMTFTGDIKLTGNTTIKDVVFNKVDKENNKVAGKIVKGKFEYAGPNESALTF